MDISVSKIYTLDQEPNIKEINRYWYDLTNKCLKRYDGSSWTPININAEDVNIITSSGSQTLSQYLNSQFSIIGDALDSIEASKANIADVVTLSGDQTITGNKTFTGGVSFKKGNYEVRPDSNGSGLEFGFQLDNDLGYGARLSTESSGLQISLVGGYSVWGNATTQENPGMGNKLIVTDYGSSTSAVPSLKDGSPIEVYSKSEIDTSLSNKQDKLRLYWEGEKGSSAENVITLNGDVTLNSFKFSQSESEISKIVYNIDDWIGYNTEIPTTQAIDSRISQKIQEANLQTHLNYYSETSGDTPSATISVANINLIGSVAEGMSTNASGDHSHAEGNNTTASGQYSHAEGNNTTAEGKYSHAEGQGTTASGNYSHAEGFATTTSGNSSHAEGNNTNASGAYSHAEGCGTTASGNSSHAEGYYTITSSQYQHTQGKFNIEDANNKYADIIGNGSASFARSNASTVSWDGISWSQSDVRAGGTDQDSATHSLSAKQNATDNSLTTTNKTIVGAINEVNTALGTKANSDNVVTVDGNETITGPKTITTYFNFTGTRLVSIGNAGGGAEISFNAGSDGSITGVDFGPSLPSPDSADNTKVPSTKVVSDALALKQDKTDNSLETTDKTIVGAINELNAKAFNPISDIITDVWTSTSVDLVVINSDSKYANIPGTIRISPSINNTGAIYVGQSITDKSKAFPLYPNQVFSFSFSNINDFKISSDDLGDKCNYIIEFGVVGSNNQ